jgi:exonuclease SbcC
VKLERVTLQGLTRFRAPVSIDFRELGDGLISLSGDNGEGKTTLLEAAPAALYRILPFRKSRSLYDYASGRDAFVEAEFSDDGQTLLAKVLIDAEGRKTEGYLTVDGAPVSSGKARDFDAAVEERFGSSALFLASVFAAQNRAGDFLTAPRSARKALFAELLGLGRLETLSGLATERAAELKDRYARLQGEERALAERVVEIRDLHDAIIAAGTRATHAERVAEERERHYQEALAEVQRLQAVAAGAAARRAELQEADTRAARRLSGITDQKREAEESLQRVLSSYDRLVAVPDTTAEERRESVEQLRVAGVRAQRRRADAEKALGREGAIRDAIERLGALQPRLEGAQQAAEAWAKAEGLRDREKERVEALEGAAGNASARAACFGVDADLFAKCGLVAGARKTTADLHEARERLKRAQQVLASLDPVPVGRIQGLQQEIETLRPLAAELALVDQARASLGMLDEESEAALMAHNQRLEALERAAADRVARLDEALEQIRVARAASTRTLGALDDEEEELLADRGRLAQELAGLEAPPAIPDVSPLERERTAARTELADAQRAQATIAARLETAQADQAKLDTLRDEIDAVMVDLSDWRILAEATGKNGVQALEIDAAGPAVAERANLLLDACYGPRFSLGFETLREKRSAKGEYTEVFEVYVWDRGTKRLYEDLSGGERVIVGEALSLALAIYNAQQSSVRWETLWRDETAGALAAGNAQAYVDMLRRAMEVGGFKQVIYVSHVPEVWARADVQVLVADGRVSV